MCWGADLHPLKHRHLKDYISRYKNKHCNRKPKRTLQLQGFMWRQLQELYKTGKWQAADTTEMLFHEKLEPASASTPEHRLPVDTECKWLKKIRASKSMSATHTKIPTENKLSKLSSSKFSKSLLASWFERCFRAQWAQPFGEGGWLCLPERSQLSPWPVAFIFFPRILFMAPVKLVTSPLHWNRHQEIYTSWIKKHRVPEMHLELKDLWADPVWSFLFCALPVDIISPVLPSCFRARRGRRAAEGLSGLTWACAGPDPYGPWWVYSGFCLCPRTV